MSYKGIIFNEYKRGKKMEENNNKNWLEIDPETWNYTQEGDEIQGVLLNREPKTEDISARYFIDLGGDKIKTIWGSSDLDKKLRFVEDGELIKITFIKKIEIDKSKTYKIFKVEVLK